MRTTLCATLAAGLLLASAVRANDEAAVRAVIDKAVKAHGGAEKLAKYKGSITKVNGKPAVGVRVSHKGHRDINLYFDKDKGLLLKIERTVKDLMAGGKESQEEVSYSDYKEVEGVQQPTKLVIKRDGKDYVDGEAT